MTQVTLLAKRNSDGSYSTAVRGDLLVTHAFVDFYNESTGLGYQRNETQRAKRGRDIEAYIRRCVAGNIEPALFELTANARVKESEWSFDPLDEGGELGILTITSLVDAFLSLIDGGTRFLGIQNALAKNLMNPDTKFDVRIFVGMSMPEEIGMFLLINDTQKKVRTDLGLRVVQRLLDDSKLTDRQLEILQTVVPETDSWKYESSRMASALNGDNDSNWFQRIQMPGEGPRAIALQAFFTSLQSLLIDQDIKQELKNAEDRGDLLVDGQTVGVTTFLIRVLRNFWEAVGSVNPDANSEPATNVLWAPIGANSHHMALAKIIKSMLATNDFGFGVERFRAMMEESHTAMYEYWFTKGGTKLDYYPKEKGDGTTMTGVANYKRVAEMLEKEWRAKIHSDKASGPITA